MSSYKEILEKYKKFYTTLLPVRCSVLGVQVYFTGSGFNHILRKNRKDRNIKDQIRRFISLENVREIIQSADTVFETRRQGRILFWSIGKKRSPKVIICKNTRGNTYFVSIIP